jgi:hypothetical protein
MVEVKGKIGSKLGPVLKVRQVYSNRRDYRGKIKVRSVCCH